MLVVRVVQGDDSGGDGGGWRRGSGVMLVVRVVHGDGSCWEGVQTQVQAWVSPGQPQAR